jgi:cobalt-zinc-cadmium efflux system membrane fusion protein
MKQNALTIGVFAALIALFAFAANDWKLPGAGKPAHGADWCEEHQIEESKCEKCHPALARGGTTLSKLREPAPGECANTVLKITLTAEVAKQAGLQVATLENRTISESIRANAETMYAPSRFTRVATRVAGVIREVRAGLGQEVEAGAALAVVESADFAGAKADYLQAIATLDLRRQRCDQETVLFEKKITAGRELLEAKTSLEEAKLALLRASQKLAVAGLSAAQIEEVAAKRDTSGLLEVTAPFKGVVVDVAAVAGETAAPERPLFSVADLERVWLTIDVTEADLAKIEKEQKVSFTVEGMPETFRGRVVAVGGEVDDRTRTIRVVAELKNPKGLLRAKMFGRADLQVKPAEAKLLVPRVAVQNDGDCTLVFVAVGTGSFQARKVEIGAAYGAGYEVLGGLAAGESVATTGSFLLKTEVLRGQIGAG